jgi:glutamate-ammonia-ligase adenylyltransferase
MLQLSHQGNPAPIRVPGTLEALAALHDAGYLETGDFEFFSESYRFLRNVEARLRLMNTTLRHDLPEDPADLVKLARLLGYPSSTNLLDDCRDKTTEVRRRFLTFFPKT